MDEIKDAVRQFVLATYLIGEAPESLSDSTRLQSSGILDSLATLKLVMFLEERYGIQLEFEDTTVDRFDSLADIAACVARKQNSPAVRSQH
jgi:acyl carrier protein